MYNIKQTRTSETLSTSTFEEVAHRICSAFLALIKRFEERVVPADMLAVDENIGDRSLASGFDNLKGEELGVLHVDDFAFETLF